MTTAQYSSDDEGPNEYELLRLERIKQNQNRLKQLGLDVLSKQLIPVKRPAPASQKGISRKKRLTDESITRRRSDRIKGVAADGAHILSEGRNGEVTAVGISALTATTPSEPQTRHFKGDVPFSSNPDDTTTPTSSDAAFLDVLARTAATLKDHKPATSAGMSVAKLVKLNLAEEDVAKVTKQAITHMAFMPTANTLIIAAADKRGALGLWHADHQPTTATATTASVSKTTAAAETKKRSSSRRLSAAATKPQEAEEQEGSDDAAAEDAAAVVEGSDITTNNEQEEYDGVLSFSLHSQYISGLKWAGGEGPTSKLHTGSYDGSLRILDAEKAAFVLAWSDEEMEYSCLDVTSDGNTAYMGDNNGALDVVDIRAGQRTHSSIVIHRKKVNTVHIEPVNQNLVVTGATDAAVHIWDVRKMGAKMKPVSSAAHNKTCQAAYFAPDGSTRVASTSFDDTVRIWDGKKGLAPIHAIKHDNQTGRWVLPFRAVWTQDSDGVVVGNMRRYVDVLDVETGVLKGQLSSGDYMTAIAARNCVHPLLPVVASGTASGRLHLYR